MKATQTPLILAVLGTACGLNAASLMLNFHTDGTGAVSGAANLTLSPGHDTGAIPATDTTWNNFNATASSTSLTYSDGSPASGVSVTFGSESGTTANAIDYTTIATINVTALDGTGGGDVNFTRLMTSVDSIYGSGTSSTNTAPGRAGWLGNASGPNDGLGLRIDGLAGGDYVIYVMGRNTNSNTSTSMDFFVGTGSLASSFDYSALTAFTEANPSVPNTNPTGHDAFAEGANYVAVPVTLADGDSLFLASDGNASDAELRGFLNMVQIVPVPEPSVPLLALLPGLFLLRRRRH